MTLTAVQRARMRKAAIMLQTGEHRIPYECGQCQSQSMYQDPDIRTGESATLLCMTCGARTPLFKAKQIRRARIKAFINAGIDLPEMRCNG